MVLFAVLVGMGQVVVFAGLLATMSYLGFQKVEHGLRLSDVTLTGEDFLSSTNHLHIMFHIYIYIYINQCASHVLG
jgi:hypothetical protein